MSWLKSKIILAGAVFVAGSSAVAQSHNFEEALHISTRFFGAQRCGPNAKSWIGHESCHWDDGKDNGVDLSGGWHDCGDHIKFGQTGGFAAAVLLHGYLNFPQFHEDRYSPEYSAGNPNGIPDILDEVKHYTDYALKMLQGNRLYYQVSDMATDHKSCSAPDFQTTDRNNGGTLANPRHSYYVEDGGASNIAGMHAAVLAMMSRAYRPFDAAYADKCLDMAKKLFAFGDKKHESVGAVNRNEWGSGLVQNSPYSDDSFADDMGFGAVEIYLAMVDNSGDPQDGIEYFRAARDFRGMKGGSLPTYYVLNYDKVAPLAAYSLVKAGDRQITPLLGEVGDYLGKMTDYGFAFWNGWGSLKYTAAGAYVALLAYDLDPTRTEFLNFAEANIKFILGSHSGVGGASAGYSFLSGYGNSYPMDRIHHMGAFGGRPGVFGSWDGQFGHQQTANKERLVGAVVGGPTGELSNLTYREQRGGTFSESDPGFKSSEVCIYYNAPFVSALGAYLSAVKGGDLENRAPTDIRLTSLRVSAGEAGANVGNLSTVDPDAGDSHTYSVTSGGDKFEISGSTLRTRIALSPGDHVVRIKTTDKGGLSFEKNFTIEAVAGSDPDPEDPTVDTEDVLTYLGWYAYASDNIGSTLNGNKTDLSYSDVISGGKLSVSFNMGENDGTNYPSLGLTFDTIRVDGRAMNFSDVGYVKFSYKSNEPVNMRLPLPGTGWNEYSHQLQATGGSFREVNLALNTSTFRQAEGWGTEVPFDKSKIYSILFAPEKEGATTNFEINSFQLEGVNRETSVVTDFETVRRDVISFAGIESNNLRISVPQSGYYSLKLYSLNGQLLGSIVSQLTDGINSVNLGQTGSLGANVAILRVSGMGTTHSMRIPLR